MLGSGQGYPLSGIPMLGSGPLLQLARGSVDSKFGSNVGRNARLLPAGGGIWSYRGWQTPSSCRRRPRPIVTWHCEHLEEVDRPQSRHEERRLLRTIQRPPPPPAHTDTLDQCNHALSQTFAQQEGIILAATADVSSKLAGPERRASWSVATLNGVQAFAREGLDQSIFTAEAWAVPQAFLAANHAAKPLRLIRDNLSVVRQVQRIHDGGHPGPVESLSLVLQ